MITPRKVREALEGHFGKENVDAMTGCPAGTPDVFLFIAGIYLTIDSFQINYFSLVTGLPIGPWQAAMCFGLAVLLIASFWYTINRIKLAFGNQEDKPIESH